MSSTQRVVALLLACSAALLAAQAGPSAPVVARVTGDGNTVSFAWYSANGATAYEVLRSPDSKSNVVTLAQLPGTTLGYEDRQPPPGRVYYQIVAVGRGGVRTPGAWLLYWPPTVTSVSGNTANVVVTWSAVGSAPGGYEIWRTPDTGRSPVRVGAVSGTTLTYRDQNPGTGPLYYRVVAVGAGGARATSPWVALNSAPTAAAASASLTPAGRPISSAGLASQPPPSSTGGLAPTSTSAISLNNASPITNLQITGTTPTTVSLSWSTVAGATGYRVYRAVGGGAAQLVTTLAASGQTSALATTTVASLSQFTDVGLLPGTTYGFEVSPVYPSPPQSVVGAPVNEGPHAGPVTAHTQPGAAPASLAAHVLALRADQRMLLSLDPNSSDPQVITQMKLAQTALQADQQIEQAGGRVPKTEVDVELDWPAAPDAAGYVLFRDGTPIVLPTAPVVRTRFVDIPPSGTHVYTVASVFQTPSKTYVEGDLANLPSASASVVYGYYRVILERIVVNQPTSDTPFDGDGKGDEVYATADAYQVGAPDSLMGNPSFIRSRTYGDVNNHSTRVRAGSLSAQGGLKMGDMIPDNAGSCQDTLTDHCIPMEIFHGILAKGMLGAFIAPRLWESDDLDTLSAPLAKRFLDALRSMGSPLSVLSTVAGTTSAPLSTLVASPPYSRAVVATNVIPPPAPQLLDRPVGIASAGSNALQNTTTYQFDEQVIPLSYELAESLATGALSSPPMGTGEFVITFKDLPSGLDGIYTLVFVVQRCSSGC